jgi:hypothetical protein
VIDTILTTIEGVWLFLLRLTETAPIGVWSFLIAAIVPACLSPRLGRALPEGWHPASRSFIVETIALAAGIGLAWLPWQTLQGALVGIVAGLLSPYLTKGWMAAWGVVFRWWARRMGEQADVARVAVGGVDPRGRVYWKNHAAPGFESGADVEDPAARLQDAALERAEADKITPRPSRTRRPPLRRFEPPPGGDP